MLRKKFNQVLILTFVIFLLNKLNFERSKTKNNKKESEHQEYSLDPRQSVVVEPKSLEPGKQYRLLFVIHTAVNHFSHRKFIRDTWGSRDRLENANATLIFVIAKSEDEQVEKQAEEESERHGDMLQTGGLDKYRDIVYKAIGWMKWLRQKDIPADVVIKMDDDVVPHVNHMLQYVQNRSIAENMRTTKMFYCWEYYTSIIRDPNSPWYIAEDVYKSDSGFFPTYCSGITIMMTHGAVRALADSLNHLSIPIVPIDDAFLTGIVAEPLGIGRVDIVKKIALNPDEIRERIHLNDTLIFGAENKYAESAGKKMEIWEKIK